MDLLPGFDRRTIETEPGVGIHVRSAGRGAPVLLLHGHPQTSSTWHAVAPALAETWLDMIGLSRFGETC